MAPAVLPYARHAGHELVTHMHHIHKGAILITRYKHTSCKTELGVLTFQTWEARNSIFQAEFGKSNFAENGEAVEIHV